MSGSFLVKTSAFEGPLDLLLDLIEKRKLFINDISLAKVTDDYISHINQLSEYDIKNVADFIFVASTLLLIKSKSLLPNMELTKEEEGNIENLQERLKLYQETKRLSGYVAAKLQDGAIFQKEYVDIVAPVFSPGEDMKMKDLFFSAMKLISKFPKKAELKLAKVKKIISLDKVIENLRERIKASFKMSFNQFSGRGKTEKINIIISFLAMLELVKQNLIVVVQKQQFGDIDMETNDPTTPRY